MKKIILLHFFCFFSVASTQAQCTSNGTAFGNNASIPMYNVTGMVSVVLNTNNSVTINLGSTFATAAGPDVRVFLVDRGTLTTAQLRMTSNFLMRPRIEMGMINANGVATYTQTIPNGMNISNFNTIYFYCQQFNQFWDFGSFTPFTNVTCASLSNESFSSNQFKVYPNPSKGTISIDFDPTTEIKSVQFFSVTGQKVLVTDEAISSNTVIDISTLKSGIYFMQVMDKDNVTFTKKISLEH